MAAHRLVLRRGIRRLLAPPEVAGGLVLGTALAGIVVNVAATWLVARADRASLNVEGAFQHILNDLFAFIATAVAGLVVVITGWGRADAIAALVVAALMARAGWGLIRDSWRIFLEAAPRGTDAAAIDHDLHAVEGVLEIHDLHVWEVTSGFAALSAHVLIDPDHDCHQRRQTITTLLHDRYGLDHTTLQIDHPAPTLVPPPNHGSASTRPAIPARTQGTRHQPDQRFQACRRDMSGLHACGSWRADQRFTGGQARDRCYCTTRYLTWGRRWPLSPLGSQRRLRGPGGGQRSRGASSAPRSRAPRPHRPHTPPNRPPPGIMPGSGTEGHSPPEPCAVCTRGP